MTAVEATPDAAPELAERIAAIASDKKAIDIRVIDLRGIVSYTDFFVICSGNTERQAKAIHDSIYKEELKKGDDDRLLPRRTEGAREARWILLDYWDVIVHVFTPKHASTTAWNTSGAKPRPAPSADPLPSARSMGTYVRAVHEPKGRNSGDGHRCGGNEARNFGPPSDRGALPIRLGLRDRRPHPSRPVQVGEGVR